MGTCKSAFFLHTQKINPPGIYEGNSPEIFDAVTFSKVCEQAALDSFTQARPPSDSRNKFWAKCHLRLNCEQTNMNFFNSKCCQIPLEITSSPSRTHALKSETYRVSKNRHFTKFCIL